MTQARMLTEEDVLAISKMHPPVMGASPNVRVELPPEDNTPFVCAPESLNAQRFLVPPRMLMSVKYHDVVNYLGSHFIDRTGTIVDQRLPNIVIEQSIPSVAVDPGSFEAVTDAVAKATIKKAADANKPIAVLYSGGLDSMCVASALLKAGANITIVGSQTSIAECPSFYNEVLCKNEKVTTEISNPIIFVRQYRNDYLWVTGECGAHIMGSVNWRKFNGASGEDYKAVLSSSSPLYGLPESICSSLMPVIDACPLQLKTNYDYQWWVIFALKWQFVAFRFQMWTGGLCLHFVNFFMDDAYQHWAMCNDVTVKCPGYEWKNYKMPMRDYIYAFSADRAAAATPKRYSMELTYPKLQGLHGTYVAAEPREVGFIDATTYNQIMSSPNNITAGSI